MSTETTEQPGSVRAALAGLRRRVRLAMIALGLGKVLCLGLALTAASAVLDRAFRFPRGLRLVLLCGAGGCVLWQLWRRLLRPITDVLPDEALALEVEQRWTGPADLLASAVWFAAGKGGGGSSSALRAVALRHAEKALRSLAPAQFVDWRRARKWSAVGFLGCAFAVIAAVVFADAAGIWFRRNLLLAQVDWPRRTQLTLLDFPGREMFVARGADVIIRVRASGAIPSVARLRLRGADSGRKRAIVMDRTGKEVFAAEITALLEPTTFSIHAGDGFVDEHYLEVVERPAIAGARLVLDVPDYIAPGLIELPWSAPSFDIPLGSRATILMEVTKPLASAHCRLDDGREHEAVLTGPLSFRYEHDVDTDVNLQFVVKDSHGIGMAQPVRAELRVVEDTPPQVRLAAAGVGSMVTPSARVALSVAVTDDYGIEGAWLELQHEGPAGTQEFPKPNLWQGTGQREMNVAETVDLLSMDLPANGRLVFAAAARDGRVRDGPNIGRSMPLDFRLVRPHELLAALLVSQQDLRRDMEQQIERQDMLSEKLGAALSEPDAGGVALDAMERSQRAMAGVLDATAAGVGDVLDQMLNNRILSSENGRRRSAGIVLPLRSLASSEGPVLRAALALASAGETGRLPEALPLMHAAAGEMRVLRARMMLLEDYAALRASVEEISVRQRDLMGRTQLKEQETLNDLLGD